MSDIRKLFSSANIVTTPSFQRCTVSDHPKLSAVQRERHDTPKFVVSAVQVTVPALPSRAFLTSGVVVLMFMLGITRA